MVSWSCHAQLYQRDIRTGEASLIFEREEFIGLSEAALELIPQYWGSAQ